jgi:deoxycytidylate deaminase
MRWIRIAARIAAQSRERVRHGAVIVCGGSIISWGHNQNILDPYYFPNASKLSIHAEEAAIRSLGRHHFRGDGRRYIMYVVRLNRAGDLMLSAPCDNCQSVIESFGKIKRVVHT